MATKDSSSSKSSAPQPEWAGDAEFERIAKEHGEIAAGYAWTERQSHERMSRWAKERRAERKEDLHPLVDRALFRKDYEAAPAQGGQQRNWRPARRAAVTPPRRPEG